MTRTRFQCSLCGTWSNEVESDMHYWVKPADWKSCHTIFCCPACYEKTESADREWSENAEPYFRGWAKETWHECYKKAADALGERPGRWWMQAKRGAQ